MKYRVLHSIAGMSPGGAQTFIMNVWRNIDKEKYQFDFLLNRDDGSYIGELKLSGCKIYTVPTRREGIKKEQQALDSFFGEHASEYDAVHIHRSSLTSIDVLKYAKKYGIHRRIFHCHSTNQVGFAHHIFHWFRKPVIHSWANKYLACSDVAADWAFNWTGVRNKVMEMRNGIDTGKFKFNPQYRTDARKELRIPEDALVIGHAGRFLEVKNHTFIIDVFSEVIKQRPNSYLLLAGVGPLFEKMKQKVNDLKLTDKVLFLGNRDDMPRLLSAMDIFLFPSLYEGLPFAPVEAQAAGVRVVCSDKVSPEVKLSEGLKFVSLEQPVSLWARELVEFPIIDKEKMRQSVIANGYDIVASIKMLEDNVYNYE